MSSVIAALASNQSTGSSTGLRFVKKEPMLGLGASCRMIWSLMSTLVGMEVIIIIIIIIIIIPRWVWR